MICPHCKAQLTEREVIALNSSRCGKKSKGVPRPKNIGNQFAKWKHNMKVYHAV